MVKFQQENNYDVSTTCALLRLVEHIKDEVAEVRKASARVLFEVLDVKEHEEMLHRKKVEQTRARAATRAAKRLLEVFPPVPSPALRAPSPVPSLKEEAAQFQD
jgi:LmbE family N-acetylglucosaminyl deacetylase